MGSPLVTAYRLAGGSLKHSAAQLLRVWGLAKYRAGPTVAIRSAADPMSMSLGLGLLIAREIVVGHSGTLGGSSSVAGGTISASTYRERVPAM